MNKFNITEISECLNKVKNSYMQKFELIKNFKEEVINTNRKIDIFLSEESIDEESKCSFIMLMNNNEISYLFELNNINYKKYNLTQLEFTIEGRLSGEIEDEFSQFCNNNM